ncbi:hypothetical protein ACWGR4_42920 [Embleya sp. NPDC055664]|uniref:hypothetical protein n=1 Tax=Embleya sp. NPDC059237 TaxID=3346784 RepID=UPI0036BCBB98
MSDPKAINLRFPDPAQRAAIAAAAKAEGVSMQEYILGAAYARATALENRFIDAFRASMARSGEAFAAAAGDADPTPEYRAAERQAAAELESESAAPKRGHAA